MTDLDTTIEVLDKLDTRLRRASISTPVNRPWIEDERAEILQRARACLGVSDGLIPTIRTRAVERVRVRELTVETLAAESWPRCYAAAHLYLPVGRPVVDVPLVLLCCGHAQGGKSAPGYRAFAEATARSGAAVLAIDNLGQGERVAMGHKEVVGPIQFGLSLQGLIVMETIAWLRWAQDDGRFDSARIAAVGNSGGGTLTLFLGALCRDELAAVSSSGYPGSFEFIARKEKRHCHCNILPGMIGSLEMWQLFGSIAPTPLFLFQGKSDHLFPVPDFHRNARKTANAYRQRNASWQLRCELFSGGHSWDDERRRHLVGFVVDRLGLVDGTGARSVGPIGAADPAGPADCWRQWPSDALTVDELARHLTGSTDPVAAELADLYPLEPGFDRTILLPRVDAGQLAAQWIAFTSEQIESVPAPPPNGAWPLRGQEYGDIAQTN